MADGTTRKEVVRANVSLKTVIMNRSKYMPLVGSRYRVFHAISNGSPEVRVHGNKIILGSLLIRKGSSKTVIACPWIILIRPKKRTLDPRRIGLVKDNPVLAEHTEPMNAKPQNVKDGLGHVSRLCLLCRRSSSLNRFPLICRWSQDTNFSSVSSMARIHDSRSLR